MAQYIEKCSLEEEKDEQLIEWWGRLLVDASTNYDAKHAFYTSVLKQVSALELELLEVLVRNSPGTYPLENVVEADYVHDFGYHQDALSLSNLFTDRNIAASVKEIRRWHEGPGRMAVNIFVDDAASHQLA